MVSLGTGTMYPFLVTFGTGLPNFLTNASFYIIIGTNIKKWRKFMEHFKFISNNENSTKEFAKKLAANLKKKDVIVLTGELGSGKTKFTEGILTYFGLEKEISSPTFTIVNEYKKNDINIYHFDVYRLEDSSEFYEIGGEEYFENGISIIEWGELIEDALPKNYLHITFQKNNNNEDERILNVDYSSKRWGDYFENFEY
jgi:tRNA threonylcarbamoyladenosine biosynthesis protein TsaE